jgi:oligopeptide/dipeptide ABC transporter ATP-binding protein
MTTPLLQVDDLRVRFESHDRTVNAVNGVSFNVFPGETVGIVGESGSGKTVTVLSLLGLVPSPPARIDSGRALFEGRDLLALDADALRSLRGKDVAVVFQDPMTSLNPVIKVGEQLREALWTHARDTDDDVHRARAIELLALVGVPQPERRYHQYPHEFSGGMRQRAMIAMAIANRPKLLIADEPTTALDVTIQAQVLDVLMAAKAETGAATVLITHDLGLVAQVADRVAVMYAGRIVEEGTIEDIFLRPSHPYTIGLLASLPSIEGRERRLYSIPGQPPLLDSLPEGCSFRPRCAIGSDRPLCAEEAPDLHVVEEGHRAECHYVAEAMTWAVDRLRDPGPATGGAR